MQYIACLDEDTPLYEKLIEQEKYCPLVPSCLASPKQNYS